MVIPIDAATVVDHRMRATDRQRGAFPLRRSLHGLGRMLSTSVLVLAAAAFVLLGVGPHVLGYRTVTMLTGSMAPGINPGDVVVTMPKPAAHVAVGDIVTYQIPVEDHRVETHRVIRVTHDSSGRLAIVTKGDANNGADPWVATINGPTVWQAKVVIPHLGSAIRVLRSPVIQFGAMWTALGGLVLLGLWRIWSSDEDSGDEASGG
ncbi:signal peptidase I [Nostocoides sp. HKS02]|uniref:signal peptidase I n=1 Tax=Nostocoides sp. HKS02 TaxID=1813880 RepID=UPI0018A81356|nr:signal peptidase I [Tetrasphaera sp. HKS02]